MEKRAEAFNGRKVNARGRLVVKRGDRAAIETRPYRDIGDAQFVAPHEKGQVAADHFWIFQQRVLRRITKKQSTRNYAYDLYLIVRDEVNELMTPPIERKKLGTPQGRCVNFAKLAA